MRTAAITARNFSLWQPFMQIEFGEHFGSKPFLDAFAGANISKPLLSHRPPQTPLGRVEEGSLLYCNSARAGLSTSGYWESVHRVLKSEQAPRRSACTMPKPFTMSGTRSRPLVGNTPLHGMTEVSVRLMGEFRVAAGERSLCQGDWKLRKACSLVKILALSPGHELHRERVLDMLWPELEPKAAANNLYYALHVARRLLEPLSPGLLRFRGEMLTLGPAGQLTVDAEAFEETASSAIKSKRRPALEVALSLYGGELLPADRYEDWASAARDRLSLLHLALLSESAEMAAREGQPARAAQLLRQVVAFDTTNEHAPSR